MHLYRVVLKWIIYTIYLRIFLHITITFCTFDWIFNVKIHVSRSCTFYYVAQRRRNDISQTFEVSTFYDGTGKPSRTTETAKKVRESGAYQERGEEAETKTRFTPSAIIPNSANAGKRARKSRRGY